MRHQVRITQRPNDHSAKKVIPKNLGQPIDPQSIAEMDAIAQYFRLYVASGQLDPCLVYDETLLKYPKSKIITALTMMLLSCRNESELGGWIGIATAVSQFQSGVGDRPAGIDVQRASALGALGPEAFLKGMEVMKPIDDVLAAQITSDEKRMASVYKLALERLSSVSKSSVER